MDRNLENIIAKFISISLALITVLVVAGPVSDPVNVPKFLILGTVAFALLPIFGDKNLRINFVKDKILVFTFSAFLFFSIWSTFTSSAPLSQNLYGVFGRNNGLITIMSFLMIFVAITQFSSISNLDILVKGLIVAGILNIIYGLIENFFGDPIPWNNNYGALLGTFGNPDFAGAFYGLLTALWFSYALYSKTKVILRWSSLALLIFTLYCVLLTDTTQGLLVSAISISIVGWLYLKLKIKNKIFSNTYLILLGIGAVTTLLGILQKGPLSSLLYKRSVSLRGSYWDAAINTGNQHLWTGVGLDSFGNWYRRMRSLKAATWMPGPETITNVSHNYYLDIYASGGLPLLLSYSAVTCIGIVSCIKIIRKTNEFQPLPVMLVGLFIGFQAQSFISIPQIGLAVWGWVVVGALYSYSKIINSEITVNINSKKQSKKYDNFEKPWGIFIFIGLCIGFLVAIPPYSADAKWSDALKSQDLKKLEVALKPSYFTPQESNRLANAVILLENNKLPDQAYKYALQGVDFNGDNFDAWKMLYYATKSTAVDKSLALSNMKRLDPLNKNLEKLK